MCHLTGFEARDVHIGLDIVWEDADDELCGRPHGEETGLEADGQQEEGQTRIQPRECGKREIGLLSRDVVIRQVRARQISARQVLRRARPGPARALGGPGRL